VNFELSDEQRALRAAARGTLGRHDTLEAARSALDGDGLPDLWPTAREAGWPGLLIDERFGGVGLGALEAMLVVSECGRTLAPVPLLGHLPATGILDAAAKAGADLDELLRSLADGDARAAFAPALPADDLTAAWTVDPIRGHERGPTPVVVDEDGKTMLAGSVHWVLDLPGADTLVVAAVDCEGALVAALLEPTTTGVVVEPVTRFDATRSLGHLQLDRVHAQVLDGIGADELRVAWFLSQCLLAAESLGAV
jgi:alkylation response protein AidB-like acyl-CoA dehydrogenase